MLGDSEILRGYRERERGMFLHGDGRFGLRAELQRLVLERKVDEPFDWKFTPGLL